MCNLAIEFTGSADVLISEAENAITEAGGSFEGDATEGSFELTSPVGKAKGTYTITGNTINIIITKKPVFVSCEKIENELKKRLPGSIE